MSDGFTATLDATALLQSLHRLGDTALRFTVPASHITAVAIQREAQRRVARDTGATAEGIHVEKMHNGTGYVVLTSDARADVGQTIRSTRYSSTGGKARLAPSYFQMKHVGLWLEAGTRKGAPGSHSQAARPFFWPAVRLEESAHERRISDAIGDALAAEGLGS